MKVRPSSLQRRSTGFTIVELLIVIVVIGILAAITIVAYNGIQNRAKSAALQSDTANAYKTIEAYKYSATNTTESYPSNLAAAGLTSGANNTPSYTSYNSNRGYCVQFTNGLLSYYAVAGGSVKEGTCTPITNLLTNTSVETDLTGLTNIGNASDRTIEKVASSSAKSGDNVLRLTIGPSGALSGYGSNSGSLAVGTYTGSVWLRPNFTTSASPYFEGTSTRTIISQPTIALPANTWTQVAMTVNVTVAGTIKVGFLAGTGAQGNWLEADAFMLTSGSTVTNFADGSNQNWVWNGVANASTSTGPAL